MELLIVSNVVLWITVILMGIVILALTRQIGVLYERVAPAGALAVNKNLEVGQKAPEMALQTIASTLVDIGGVAADGKSQLLFFVSPDCPVCKTLLPALKSAASHEADWLRLVLASDGMEQDHKGYIAKYGLDKFPYVVSELLGKTYGVSKLPYAVVIDEEGKVASMGIINSREHLDSLFEAKERRVASIQDYLNPPAADARSLAVEVK
ncbi:MAG: redoxin domain-containing protein [Gammaproteobacteria bacterium]|uniref:redoxin domain-containing protein n=1 Tax=Pseudomaricurvus alcaniphilus TaxID=1166482 RepID=UPI00140C112A|nr:redoxin domain-containing protein [Pseudomaricurvus alcaniphilus]MBR9910081.1 redoxin domain-containing protein [Gammaproteobacteria bacterium]NHN36597.1 redoxin domain-containing protein [Pseudomaricurvus alcaniphilus]